uniref:Rho-GAP domain-containing protein n=1 Tax=Lates calcarifer TaxID=8187 RepID=A0A4W6FUH5_LATCA
MKITDCNVIRFHLQVLYGITVKSLEKKKDRLSIGGAKIFGVPLENLPRRYIPEFGLVPCFLVDACSFLLERAGTVGLFRKPGSLPRIKVLRAKLNRGEGCLSAALPYDVATLIKQFCRELPEPLFPSELHAALLKAQALSDERDRTSALQLLSCLLPARNSSCLHYLFNFLCKVSQRYDCHVMDSMDFLMSFHFPKQAHSKTGQRKRHSFKGKKKKKKRTNFISNHCKRKCVNLLLFFNLFSQICSDAACEDCVLDSGEVKGHTKGHACCV